MSSIFNSLVTELNFAIKKRSKVIICRKSKLTISFLKLLLNKGLILNFYQLKFLNDRLCIFLKYYDKKPLIKKIIIINNNSFFKSLKLQGDIQTNIFFVISTSVGGLLLLNLDEYLHLDWYNKFGGKALFKICI